MSPHPLSPSPFGRGGTAHPSSFPHSGTPPHRVSPVRYDESSPPVPLSLRERGNCVPAVVSGAAPVKITRVTHPDKYAPASWCALLVSLTRRVIWLRRDLRPPPCPTVAPRG